MRQIRGVLLAALVVLSVLTPAARARAQEQPPLEDVVMQGRVLRPDGSPLANTPVRVDTDSGTPFFNLFAAAFTGGISLISCFDRSSEYSLCPLPSDKSFTTTTDANGRYSFTFPKAKRRGQQTNTDYFLSAAMPSRNPGDNIVLAQYELELLTPVHNAPDLVLWDPSTAVKPGPRSYEVVYKTRPNSKNSLRTFVDDKPVDLTGPDDRTIEARNLEDTTVRLVPFANKDERAEGTIYHQRFTAAPVLLRGALVPLSRGAACTVVRRDGSRSGTCGYTDGDVVTAAVADDNPCRYDTGGRPYDSVDVRTGERAACQAPVTEVTVDLGKAQTVGEVRARNCGCTMVGSADGAAWSSVPAGVFKARSIRYVRLTGSALGSTPEVSVWPPWPDAVAPTPIASEDPTPTTPLRASGGAAAEKPDRGGPVPWLLGLTAILALAGVIVKVSRLVERRNG